MDGPLRISKILSTPEIPVRNLNGTVLTRKKEVAIWTAPTVPSGISPQASTSPSQWPVGFEIPVDLSNPLQLKVPLKIEISVTFPPDWNGPMTLKLIGSRSVAGKNEEEDLIESDSWVYLVSDQTRILPTKILDSFWLKPKITCINPFALCENVIWRVEQDITEKCCPPKETVGPSTQLELYWLNSVAPFGPLVIDTSGAKTAMDMQAVYPVDVLRFYLPDVVKAGGFTSDNIKKQWVEHVMSLFQTQADKPYYNLVSGMSGYSVGCFGGGFDFAGWLGRKNPWVNSFDLSALVQIGIGLLMYKETTEVCQSEWVCKSPYGFILASNPFGWSSEDDYQSGQGANNPYFKGNEQKPLFDKLPDDPKLSIMCKVWIEGCFLPEPSKNLTVADTSFFQPGETNVAEAGTLTRLDYGKKYILLKEERELNNYANDPKNQCYVNNDFPQLAGNKVSRIGVWNLKGIPEFFVREEPSGVYDPRIEFLQMPPALRLKLERVAESSKNISSESVTTELFNDASLLPVDILPTLMAADKIEGADTDVLLSRFLSVARYRGTSTQGNKFDLEIHTHISQKNALEGLLFQLTKFESDICSTKGKPAVTIPDQKFGDYLVQHPHGYLYVLRNVLISLTLLDDSGSAMVMADMKAGLVKIHQRIYPKRCLRAQIRRPMMTLKETPATIQENTEFSVDICEPSLLAGYLDAQVIQCPLLVMNKTIINGTSKRSIEFSSLGYDDRFNTTPTVFVLGAHATTYFPGEVSFRIEVKKG